MEKLSALRKMVNVRTAEWQTYYLQGEPQPDISWCNLSYDEATGQGCFLARFRPGGRSIAHEHLDYEEFFVLDGEIEDSDGTVYRTGDFVSLKPGSRHFSVSPTGCTTAVFIRGGFRTLEPGEPVSG